VRGWRSGCTRFGAVISTSGSAIELSADEGACDTVGAAAGAAADGAGVAAGGAGAGVAAGAAVAAGAGACE
jgi:hypothetical protein